MTSNSYTPPVSASNFVVFAVVFSLIGFAVAAIFAAYELSVPNRDKSLGKELGMAVVSSTALGFGTLFVLLSAGLYV